jgi:hypothetical protein
VARGEIATVAKIKEDYEKLVGQTVHKTTIYRLLERHQWRKIVPRQSHPKVNEQEQEAFKKNFSEPVKKILETKDPEDTRPILIMAADEGRFGRLGEVRACWCPEEIRPIIAGTTSQRIYICLRRSGSPISSDEFLGFALC